MRHLDLNYKLYITSSDWENRSKFCKSLTWGRCSIFFFFPAKTVHSHHLHYDNFKNELPFRDLVPLCQFAHIFVHFLQDVLKISFRKRKQQKTVKKIINNILRLCFLLSATFWLIVRILYLGILPLVLFFRVSSLLLFK